eukprot:Phypoly_transcript_16117.p1 GENE.Phypoly_transcript_16117~~Phypoly_transcript_16117.p1  ORF type:complete len:235 (+),score=18.88 Phypoly_transcript_16117:75-779(+)
MAGPNTHTNPFNPTEFEDNERQSVLSTTTDGLPPPSFDNDNAPHDELDMPEAYSLYEEFGAKLHNLMQVLHNSLVPHLVATPLVYLGGDKWKLQSHSNFRAQKRKQLEHMIDVVKTKREVDYAKLLDEFESIMVEVFKVRLPAMIEYYANDTSYQRIPVLKVTEELCSKIEAAKHLALTERVSELANILTQWFTYCPVGRPHVYLSDDHWTLISERELRKYYRQQIASQLFTNF